MSFNWKIPRALLLTQRIWGHGMALLNNYIPYFLRNVITHPWPNFNFSRPYVQGIDASFSLYCFLTKVYINASIYARQCSFLLSWRSAWCSTYEDTITTHLLAYLIAWLYDYMIVYWIDAMQNVSEGAVRNTDNCEISFLISIPLFFKLGKEIKTMKHISWRMFISTCNRP